MAIATDGWHDPALQWRGSFERTVELVESAPAEAMNVLVPATPDWRARDLLAHMVGLDHDVLAGEEPHDHDPAWTQKHVDERADRTVAAILAEWRADAPRLVDHIKDVDPRPLNDAIIHEQDLRGALQSPGWRSSGGLEMVRDTMAGRLAAAIDDLGLAPLRLEAADDSWSWTSHRSDGTGAVLRASSYDLTRALTSRRTAEELRSWAVSGDVEPYLDAFATVGPLPEASLRE